MRGPVLVFFMRQSTMMVGKHLLAVLTLDDFTAMPAQSVADVLTLPTESRNTGLQFTKVAADATVRVFLHRDGVEVVLSYARSSQPQPCQNLLASGVSRRLALGCPVRSV
jgi:hypothetical protein